MGWRICFRNRYLVRIDIAVTTKNNSAHAFSNGLHAEQEGDDPGNMYSGTIMPDPRAAENKLKARDAKSAKREVKAMLRQSSRGMSHQAALSSVEGGE